MADPMLVIAHRGLAHLAPENTLSSLRMGIESGAEFCEFDVGICRDGTLVLMHDDTLERTTNGKGALSDTDWPAMAGLDAGSWKSEAFRGEPIPLLSQALDLFVDSSCRPVVELKQEGHGERVVQMIRERGLERRALVISDHESVLFSVKQVCPAIRCGWICGTDTPKWNRHRSGTWFQRVMQNCDADFLDLSRKIVDAELALDLDARGIEVWLYTVNDTRDIAKYQAMRIKGLTTDMADQFVAARDRV